MPNTPQESMEDVSIAYMQGLCAYNGYTLSIERRDNDGCLLYTSPSPRDTR